MDSVTANDLKAKNFEQQLFSVGRSSWPTKVQ